MRSRSLDRAVPVTWPPLALALLAAFPAPDASAQTLTIIEQPATASIVCDPAAEAPRCGAANPAEVEQRVNVATQAMILGDLAEADRFLAEAIELDPCAVEATYLKGRIVAQTQDPVAASEWFCRYLALAPFGASASEARRRLEQIAAEGAGAELLERFEDGVAHYRAGDLAAAEEAFTTLLGRHPVPEALYNRAAVRLVRGKPLEARADLERYLQLSPKGVDNAAIREAMEVPAVQWVPKSGGVAFLLGVVLPGSGQYYTGRTMYGLTVTTIVAGAAVGGYLFERTTIQCRAPDPSGGCPPDAIAGTTTERPLLVPALGVGAGVMLITALEAALHAAGREPPLTVAFPGNGTLGLGLATRPAPTAGALDVHLLQFRFVSR